jgi:hypothetical protein
MYIKILLLTATHLLITSSNAMHAPIGLNLANERQLITPQQISNQHYYIVTTIKMLAKNQKLDLKELTLECCHFKKTHGRLPIIGEAVQIAANLKKQYIRQEEISKSIMNLLFLHQDDMQLPSLEGYHHVDSIVKHLGL